MFLNICYLLSSREQARLQVDQFSGAIYKAYATQEEAEARLRLVGERRALMPGIGKQNFVKQHATLLMERH